MNRDELIRVFRALEQAGVEYVLVGGAALGMHGIIRGTEDVDLLIKASRENVQRIASALRSVYQDDPSIEGIRADDLLGDCPVVRYCAPSGKLCLDLIAGISEKETFESVDAETMEYREVRFRVATAAALYRLKKGIPRPIDRQDAAALRASFESEEDEQMGVQRFRSLEEMNAAPLPRRRTDCFEHFIRHNETLRSLAPRSLRAGVFKYRSLEEAQRGREALLAKQRKR